MPRPPVTLKPKFKFDMSFIVDYNITKFQINQDSVEVWELLNRYIVQWDGIYCCTIIM